MNSDQSKTRKLTFREWFYKYINPVFKSPYVLIAPAAVLSLIFSVFPVGYTFVNSFFYCFTYQTTNHNR